MKKDTGYFIDVERLIKWIYDNKELAKEVLWEGSIEEPTRMKNWKKYADFPSDYYLKRINDNIKKNESRFEKINIAELMICINNAKDHNRGKKADLCAITSTGKKVMTMLLLGRLLDGMKIEGFFTATKEKDVEVFEYLASFSRHPKQSGEYYYFPGRTVSFSQLCSLSKSYKNGITSRGIYSGLMQLINIGLVERAIKDKDLFKLNFEGCKDFLEKNR